MTTRSYLSIGDVLTLLREEFPDVTISKIRFLESQGLVNPERSPSGYRKFYEGDVERLRWVLRQQREHFLPLKVIRDRLAQEGGDAPSEAPAPSRQGAMPPEEVEAEHAAQAAGAVRAVQGAKAAPVPAAAGAATGVLGPRPLAEPDNREASARQENGGPRPPRAEEPAIARAVGVTGTTMPAGGPAPVGGQLPSGGRGAGAPSRAARAGEGLGGATAARTQDPGRTPQAATEHRAAPTPAAGEPATQAPAVPAPDQPPRPSPRREPTPPAAGDEPAGVPPAEAGSSGPAAATGQVTGVTEQAPTGGADVRAEPPVGVSGASLTLEELCAASGLSVTEVASLEGFGLVEPMSVAGILYYDEEALVVAKLVASYRRYGIEPRHLRLYRNAVEREMGLVEQIVTPLLRQRNPEARQRATDAAADLAKLGQQLRGSLLRREIRRQLGS